jgi:hypothetical protein
MFQEKASDAFKWLSSLGSIYVAMCSLGLEQSAQQQIQSRLCELDLIFDTDVVLSLLSSGEPQHLPVIDIVKNWERIKGHIYVAPSVLEEAAYHAWISNNNYEEVWRLLAKMNDMDAHHLIDNVFVRGFRKEAKGKYDPKSWGWYIKLFRGKTEYDYEKILEIVKEYKIDILSENIIDMEFAKQVSDTLINLKSQVGRTVSDEEIHKCKIDGRLIALLLAKRESMEQTGRSALVISSSNLFIKINEMLKYKLKEPKPIVSISAIAYLLSLVPGVNMSFDVLRRVLFDTGFPVKPVGLERFVLQMVQGSEEYFVPYAKRGSMVVNAREQIRQIAAQRGEDPNEVENKILRKDKEIKEEIAPMIAAAVDKIAISKSQRRIWELEEKIKAYEKKR